MMETGNVKLCLSNWRDLVIHADAFLGWEKDWYPAAIAGFLTLKFIFVWYWDPTLLTFLAVAGLMITLADYIGPIVTAKIFKPENWTGVKEQKYEQICESLVRGLQSLQDAFNTCREAKEKKPIMHFVGTVFALFSLAWIGNRLNTFFLLYLVTLTVAMLPGLHRKGLLKKCFAQVTLKINEVTRGKESLKKTE